MSCSSCPTPAVIAGAMLQGHAAPLCEECDADAIAERQQKANFEEARTVAADELAHARRRIDRLRDEERRNAPNVMALLGAELGQPLDSAGALAAVHRLFDPDPGPTAA